MPANWRIVLEIFVGGRSPSHTHAQERLVASRGPAAEKSIASRRLDGVVELSVGEAILIDNVLLRIHGRLNAIKALLLPTF